MLAASAGGPEPGRLPSSSRASRSRSSTRRLIRPASSSTPSATCGQSVSSGCSRATSTPVLIDASGLRSSCAASATKARCRREEARMRSIIALSVTASRRTSSSAAGTGSWARPPGAPGRLAAPCVSSSTGRSADPTSQRDRTATPATSSTTAIATVRATTPRPRSRSPTGAATSTVCESPAVPAETPTTRSGSSMPSRRPGSSTASPARARRRSAASRSGTSRSPPGDVAVTRPWASTTCRTVVPSLGRGSGTRLEVTRAATPRAWARAASSRCRRSTACRTRTSSVAPSASAIATTPVVAIVRRARTDSARGGHPHHPSAGTPVALVLVGRVGGDEPVAHAAYGDERMPPERLVDLAPQVTDVDLDDVGVVVREPAPDGRQELGLGDGPAVGPQEVLEQVELTRREGDRGSASGHGVCRGVEHEVAHADGPRGAGGVASGRPAQQRFEPGHEHDPGEGLGQVVVCPEVQAVGLVVLPVLRRQHEDWDVAAVGAQPLGHAVAGQAGEHDVEDDGVVAAAPGEPQPGLAVVREVDLEALGAQAALQRLREPHLVVDDQNPHVPTFSVPSQPHAPLSGTPQPGGGRLDTCRTPASSGRPLYGGRCPASPSPPSPAGSCSPPPAPTPRPSSRRRPPPSSSPASRRPRSTQSAAPS